MLELCLWLKSTDMTNQKKKIFTSLARLLSKNIISRWEELTSWIAFWAEIILLWGLKNGTCVFFSFIWPCLNKLIAPKLTDIFNEILNTENIPDDWTKSTIILLHKKGDKGDIGNYRPISLMSNIYKVFSKIILSRITNTLEENQPKEQAGFRRHFSTIDHIHALRQILQKFKEYNKTYYLGFIDFNKASTH